MDPDQKMNRHYVVYRLADGAVVANLRVPPEAEAPDFGEGHGTLPVEAAVNPLLHSVQNGELVDVSPIAIVRPAYDELRLEAYPAVGDQLDAIWKVLNALLQANPAVAIPASAREVIEHIALIKETIQPEKDGP